VPQWSALLLYGIALGLLVLTAVAIGVSVFKFRHARTAPYYFIREAARRSGIRWLYVAVMALILGGSIFYVQERWRAVTPSPVGVTPFVSAVQSPTATFQPSPTATGTPSPTPLPTLPSPTATPSPAPTPTPFYPMPDTVHSPLPGAVPARPEARIHLETFALGVENGQPVQPGTEFTAGDFRVYAFIRYEGMSRGATWTYGWYREGEYLDGNTCLWWVRLPNCPYMVGEHGVTFLYYRRPGGYDPGTYEVRIWIEDRFQGAFRFAIVPAQ
jgi:biotin carboxyl carrier protein